MWQECARLFHRVYLSAYVKHPNTDADFIEIWKFYLNKTKMKYGWHTDLLQFNVFSSKQWKEKQKTNCYDQYILSLSSVR